MTEATRDGILTEARGLRDIPERSLVRMRPSLPQATHDRRDALYYGATNTTINPNKIVKCVYNARSEEFELHFLYRDEERAFDRIDWQTSVPFTDAVLAKWLAAVKENRKTTTPPACVYDAVNNVYFCEATDSIQYHPPDANLDCDCQTVGPQNVTFLKT